jgi:N12 class adenine-specific DNA methylase
VADNPFARSAVSNALDAEQQRLSDRAKGLMPRSIQGNPATPQPPRTTLDANTAPAGAPPPPNAAQPPQSAREGFETIARKSRVPVNILMSMAEMAGADSPDTALQMADRAATGLAPLLKQGIPPDQALQTLLGDSASPEAVQTILDRARKIGAELYPREKPATDENGNVLTDAAATVAGGVVGSGIGGAIRGGGELVAAAADTVNRPINAAGRALTGHDILQPAPVLGKETSENLQKWSDEFFGDMITEDTKQAIQNSQLSGDAFNPSTWSVGEDWSFKGIAFQAIEVFGSMVPIVAAGIVTGGAGAIAVGAAQSAGDQAQSSDAVIDQMAQNIGPDGKSQLEAESSKYRKYIAEGATPEQALNRTKADAARVAAVLAAPVGALGGKLTSKIVDPATAIISGSNRLARTAGRGALGFVEEGSQEVSETMAGRLGINQGAGTNIDITKDTLADLIMGGLAGGATGVGSGVLSQRDNPDTQDPPAGMGATSGDPTVPRLPAPTLQLPPPESSAAAPQGSVVPPTPMDPAPPAKGPLETAMDAAAPASLLPPEASAGARVRIDIGDGSIEGILMGETPIGVQIRELDGNDITVPASDLTSGLAKIVPITDEPLEMTPTALTKYAQTRFEELTLQGKLTKAEEAQRKFLGDNLENTADLARSFGVTLIGEPDARPKANLQNPNLDDKTPDPAPRAPLESVGGTIQKSGELHAAGVPPVSKGTGDSVALRDDRAEAAVDPNTGKPVGPSSGKGEPGSDVSGKPNEDLTKKAETTTPPPRKTGPAPSFVVKRPPEAGKAPPDTSKMSSDELFDMALAESDTAKIAEAASSEADPAPSGISIRNVREKAAILMGVPKDSPPDVGNLKIQWSERDGGFLISRANSEAILKAAMDQAAKVTPVKTEEADKSPSQAKTATETPSADLKATIAAAASEADPAPTPAQAEAGNYKHGHVNIEGRDIAIENAKDSTRSGVDGNGKAWSVTMPAHYGRFKGTKGADGDQVDVYIGDQADSDVVAIIDQRDADTGKFDEHKVFVHVKSADQAKMLYRKGFSDGKGNARLGGITVTTFDKLDALLNDEAAWTKPMSPDFAERAVKTEEKPKSTDTKPKPKADKPKADKPKADKPKAEPEANPKETAPPVPKIEDFGEKIGGARKDNATAASADLRRDRATDTMTLQEAFPEPDYAALADNGVARDVLAVIASLRGSISRNRKPIPARGRYKSNYKVTVWAEQVDQYRNLAASLLEGSITLDELGDIDATPIKAFASKNARESAALITGRAYAGLPVDMLAEAGRYQLLPDTSQAVYEQNPTTGKREFVRYDKVFGLLSQKGGHRLIDAFADAEKAAAYVETMITISRRVAEDAPPAKPRTRAPVELTTAQQYDQNRVALFYVAFKVNKTDVIKVSGPYASRDLARADMETNRDALQEKAEALRDGPQERRTTNNPRVGPQHRKGNVTPEQFTTAFGFRGVEFGNWNTGADRQTRLNEAYDAFMDLAGVLNVPTQSLSLDGTLGLAFGARGKGGRGAAAAHYEPVKTVINLTKNAGAGSLAHEWFHALDNWLAKIDATKGGVAADPTGERAKTRNEYMTDRKRYEGALSNIEAEAFTDLKAALKKTNAPWYVRSLEADKAKGTPYFATTIELAARAFERVVIDRLSSREMTNDFLSNVDEKGGAYPTSTEARRQGVTRTVTQMLELIQPRLAELGGDMIDLPPINTDLLDDGPQEGFEWPFKTAGYNGTRKIIAREGENLRVQSTFEPIADTIEPRAPKDVAMTLEYVETLIETDSYVFSADNEVAREAAKIEKARKADKDAAEAVLFAKYQAVVDKLAASSPRYANIADKLQSRESLATSAPGFSGRQRWPLYVHIGAMVEDGWIVKKQSDGKRRFQTTYGSHYKTLFKDPASLDFADFMVREHAAAQAKAAIETPETESLSSSELFDQALAESVPVEETKPEETSAPAEAAPPAAEAAWDSATNEQRTEVFTEAGWTVKATGALNEAANRNLDRDWADLTPTAKAQVTKAVDGGIFTKDSPRSTAEAATSAASNIAGGTADALDGLMAFFGGKDTLNSGPAFSRETYEKAKPLFISAVRQYGKAGQDILEVIRNIIAALRAKGMTTEDIASMKPFVTAFADDVREGFDPFADASNSDTIEGDSKDQNDERTDPDPDVSGPLAGSKPGDVRGTGPSVSDPAGESPSENGDGGNTGNGDAGGTTGTDVERDSTTDVESPLPAGVTERAPTARLGVNPGNFTIKEDFALGEGTAGQKLTRNLEAIRLLKTLDAANRHATPAEQITLAKYVGWGGLKPAFDPVNADKTDQWGRAYRELLSLLTPQEYVFARESILNAHYTSRGVVQAMWRAMEHFGFTSGRALEPTVGTGNFLGLQPDALRASTEWHATEIDGVTGRIATYLYPDAKIMVPTGFQDAHFAKGVFDIAIGNPPFGAETIKSGRFKELSGMKIHNYIIAKSGIHLRPGGIMAMVVTHRFLDTANAEARDHLARNFRMIGAFRLPNNAFKENAGTEVVTDVVFFQKLRAGENPPANPSWLDVDGSITVEGKAIRVNRYYQDNPTHILGKSAMDGTMYAGQAKEGGEYTVHSDGRDVAAAIDAILTKDLAAEKGVLGQRTKADESKVALETLATIPVGRMIMLDDGRVMRRNLDDAGGANITQITPDTLWKPKADEWSEALDSLKDLRKTSVSKRFVTEDQIKDFERNVAAITYGANGKPLKSQTKASQFLIDALEAAKASRSALADLNWGMLQGVEKKVASMRLGLDDFARLKGLLGLRRQTLELVNAESTDSPGIETLRKDLKKSYTAFVKKFGFVNEPRHVGLMRNDTGQPFGLESKYSPPDGDKLATATPAPILTKRVIFPYREAITAETVEDAATISLQERGRVDIQHVADLTGKPIKDVRAALTNGPAPRLFFDPAADMFVDSETYLSGNVREKLREAERAGMDSNIIALRAVQPAPKEQRQIVPTIRGQWIPNTIFEQYLTRMGVERAKVEIIPVAGLVNVSGNQGVLTTSGNQFDHKDKTVIEIFTSAMRGKPMIIGWYDDDKRFHKDEDATREVNALADRMASDFSAWAYEDPDRAIQIVDAYNAKMNNFVERTYDGKTFLKPVGANPDITLRTTQKNAAWRMVQTPSTLIHHIVGAGKTFTAIVAIKERKRMGLSKKPMIVVPNHLVGQWERDFLLLYPGANVLAATPADFTKDNRRTLFARIATGDFDAVIIGHSSLGYIQPSPADTAAVVQEQVRMLESAINDAKKDGNDPKNDKGMKALVKKLKAYRERLKTLLEKPADDIGMDFTQMGVDYLAVDEAHEFKNLEYQTSGDRLVGMNDPEGSKKAFDLYVKVRGLRTRKGAIGFLTGTPISNSLVEIYSFQKYLAYDDLVASGVAHFDAWSAAFIQAETRFEYTATQTLQERRVMTQMINLKALTEMYRNVSDIALQDKISEMYAEAVREENARNGTNKSEKFPIPAIKSGGMILETAPATKDQTLFTDYLVTRMLTIKEKGRDKDYAKLDNSLWVLGDARKASIDIRTVDPYATREPNSKVVRVGNKVRALAKKWDKDKGTQLVFSDQSVPSGLAAKKARVLISDFLSMILSDAAKKAKLKEWSNEDRTYSWQWGASLNLMSELSGDGTLNESALENINIYLDNDAVDAEAVMATADTGFSFYDDLRAYLVEQGMKAEEVAFIHEYNTPEEKSALFDKVNAGDIRVLIGSTPKLGAGTNVQERIVAIHHADAPWRPSDVEQRNGRGVRQGNALLTRDPKFELELYAYSTEGTSDVVLWTVLERKARAIENFLNGNLDRMDEEGGDADSFAEFMSQSTGNPVYRLNMVTEKALTAEIAKTAGMLRSRDAAKELIARYPARRAEFKDNIDQFSTMTTGDITAMVNYQTKTGNLAEFEKAMADAKAAYDKEYDAYLVAMEAYEKQPEGKAKKKAAPATPSRPTMFSEDVLAASSYARLAKDVLTKIENSYAGDEVTFNLGTGLMLKIAKSVRNQTVGKKEVAIDRYMIVLQTRKGQVLERNYTEAQSLTRSTIVMDFLLPHMLQNLITARREEATAGLATLEKRKLAADEAVTQKPDTTERDRLRDLSEFYSYAAEIAELEEQRKRLARANRFVANDKRRPLGDGIAQNVETPAPIAFKFAGDTYTGTGIFSTSMNRGLFETYNSAGRLSFVRATRENDKEPWQATSVSVLPAGAEAEMPSAIQGEAKARRRSDAPPMGDALPTDAKLRRVRDSLNDELKRVGIKMARSLFIGDNQVDGFYLRNWIGVTADAQVGAEGTLHHEIIHALRSPYLWGGDTGLFTSDEWQTLARDARRDKTLRARIEREYAAFDTRAQTEEMVAERYRIWATAKTKTASPLFERIKAVFEAFANALRGNGFNSSAAVFERIASGEVGARQFAPDTGSKPFLEAADTFDSIDVSQFAVDARYRVSSPVEVTDADEKTLIESAITQAMASGRISLLGLVPGRPLFKELGKKLYSADIYIRLKEQMDALRDDWQSKADELAQRWRKITAANGAANTRLMDLMHDTTIAQIDPTKDYERKATKRDYQNVRSLPPTSKVAIASAAQIDKDQEREAQFYEFKKRFAALPKAFQDTYVEVRDKYSELADAFDAAILANIEKAMKINIRKAERTYEDELREIADDGLRGNERDLAEAEAYTKLNNTKARLGYGTRARMMALRAEFERNRLQGPYFPLARFGEFFVTVRDENGTVTNFSRFESVKERDAMAAAERKKPNQSVTVGVVSDIQLRAMVDPAFVAEVEHIIGDMNIADHMMDEIWQKWLATLPELSTRKNRIHRKGVEGYDKDAFRAYGRHLFHGAHQLARLTYSMDMTDALEEAKREAQKSGQPTRLGLIVKEMERRHDYTMNPTSTWWSQLATQAAFVWYLGMTPAAALVNLTQTTIVGIPVLSTLNPGRGGMKQATGQLNRALLDFTRGKGHAVDSNRLTPEEKHAMRMAYERGVIDKSQAHDLMGVAESGIEYSAARTKIMAGISYFFHHTERMNREVTFLAAYRMAKLNGAKSETALDKAADITWRTHFDYQNSSRPRVMQGDVARIFLVFRNFQVNMLWRLVRDTHQSLHGADEATKREARKQLLGITGMLMLHAGVTGTWLFGIAMMIIGLFMGDDKDPEEELKRVVVDTLGAELGGAVLYGLPGHIMGINLSDRIGMPDLWFRSPDQIEEGEDAYNYWLKQVIGAVPSIAENLFFRGPDKLMKGDYGRGIETMLPKAARDILKAGRYYSEGVTTSKGDPIIDDLPTYKVIVQALGFTPAEITERYKANSLLYNRQTQILDARSKLLGEAARMIMDKQPLSKAMIGRIDAFNAKNPDYPITGKTLNRSVSSRQQARARSELGATLNPRLNDRIRAERADLVYQ